MSDGHPLDPFAEAFGYDAFFGGGVGQVVSAEGYGTTWGFPRALGLSQKNGAGDFDGVDDGLLLAHGLKGGQAQGRLSGAPWVLEHGLHGGQVVPLLSDHAYLIGEGQKVIIAAIGYAVTFAHARLLEQGQKGVPGYGNGLDPSFTAGHVLKGGAGRAFTAEPGELLEHSEKRGAGFSFNRGPAIVLGRGLKVALGYGLAGGVPHLEVFGVHEGGGIVGEGHAFVIGHGQLLALGSHGGLGYSLSDAEARSLAAWLKLGVGFGLAAGAPFALADGVHGGQGNNFDPAWILGCGTKAGLGFGRTFGHVRVLANGSRIVVLYPIESKTGPAIIESMFGPAIVE